MSTVDASPGQGPDGVVWRKSSHSADGECLVVAKMIGIRNSNRPNEGVLVFFQHEFGEWIADIKYGLYDRYIEDPMN